MKKALIIIGLLVFGGVFYFYYQNLRGVGSAINPPARDITKDFSATTPKSEAPDFSLTLPAGFSISLFARNLDAPRVMTWDNQGHLLVSVPSKGSVVAFSQESGMLAAEKTVVAGLNRPHGLAVRGAMLYVAETDNVSTYVYDADTMSATEKKKIIDLPGGGNHYSRTIAFGPDGKLYISVGSSCNVCVEKDWRRAKILVANADGTDLKEFGTGLRNSVFFTWHSTTRDMWATDMGRDLIGDNIPPEEVNIVKAGSDYGWPYCYGKRVWDKTFDSSSQASSRCAASVAPVVEMQAHSAPLGLAFIPDSWPSEYHDDLLVAFHGSWNRTEPTGYKVVRIKLDEKGSYQGIEDFITGWQAGDGILGRPVDVLFDAAGALFITDDKAGVIYRVTYQTP